MSDEEFRPPPEPADPPGVLDSGWSAARVNPGGSDMSVPIKPARNPRWEPQADEPITLDAEPAPDDDGSYDDDVAKILTEIQSVTAVAELEARVAELEHELSRVRSGHAEDTDKVSGELTIMRARIEDALGAVGATVEQLRGEAARKALEAAEPAVPVIDEDALRERVRTEIKPARDEVVATAREEVNARVKQMRIDLDASVNTIRAEFQSSFTGLLQGMESGLQQAREQAMREITRLRERIEPELQTAREDVADQTSTLRRDLVSSEETFTGALRAFAGRLEGLQSQLSEAGARMAAERAAAAAQLQSMGTRIDALDERITEGLARLSEGILRVAENIGSATTLQRRIAALETAMSDLPQG